MEESSSSFGWEILIELLVGFICKNTAKLIVFNWKIKHSFSYQILSFSFYVTIVLKTDDLNVI